MFLNLHDLWEWGWFWKLEIVILIQILDFSILIHSCFVPGQFRGQGSFSTWLLWFPKKADRGSGGCSALGPQPPDPEAGSTRGCVSSAIEDILEIQGVSGVSTPLSMVWILLLLCGVLFLISRVLPSVVDVLGMILRFRVMFLSWRVAGHLAGYIGHWCSMTYRMWL